MAWSAAMDELARSQYGLLTFDQLRQAGFTYKQVRRLVGAAHLTRVTPGVYRCAGVPVTWRGRAKAALLAGGEGTYLTHTSAAVVWDLLDRSRFSVIEVCGPRRVRVPGVRGRRTEGGAALVVRHRLEVTAVEQTVRDMAAVVGVGELGQLVDEALRLGITSVRRLTDVYMPDRRGAMRLRSVLADRGAGYLPGANDWEARMDRLWEDAGLPPAERQHRVEAAGHHYVLDRAIVELKIAVEWNGFERHGQRHRFDYDSLRRGHLVQAGWLVLDFTSNTPLEEVIRTVLAACRDRQREISMKSLDSAVGGR